MAKRSYRKLEELPPGASWLASSQRGTYLAGRIADREHDQYGPDHTLVTEWSRDLAHFEVGGYWRVGDVQGEIDRLALTLVGD